MPFVTNRGQILTEQSELGVGGEARVITVREQPSWAVKLFRHATPERLAKVHAMIARPPAAMRGLAWPQELVFDTSSRGFVGYAMPKIAGARKAISFYNPSERVKCSPAFTYQYLVRSARNLWTAAYQVHQAGHIIGDVNESNILIADNATLTLVDTDSFQVNGGAGQLFRCLVGKPEYTPPELHGVDFKNTSRDVYADCFGLAVISFQLLMEGVHPYAGVWSQGSPPSTPDKIRQGLSPLNPRSPQSAPPSSPPHSLLAAPLRALFVRTFVDGTRDRLQRPLPDEWIRELKAFEASLKGCGMMPSHVYPSHLRSCLWCQRAAATSFDAFPGGRRGQRAAVGPMTTLPPATVRPSPARCTSIQIQKAKRNSARFYFPIAVGVVALVFVAVWGLGQIGQVKSTTPTVSTTVDAQRSRPSAARPETVGEADTPTSANRTSTNLEMPISSPSDAKPDTTRLSGTISLTRSDLSAVIRETPEYPNGRELIRAPHGTPVVILGERCGIDGYRWARVRLEQQRLDGWIVRYLLSPAVNESERCCDGYEFVAQKGCRMPVATTELDSSSINERAAEAALAAMHQLARSYNDKDEEEYFGAFTDPLECFYNKANTPLERIRQSRQSHFEVNSSGKKMNWRELRVVEANDTRVTLFVDHGFAQPGQVERRFLKVVSLVKRGGRWLITVEADASAHACFPAFERFFPSEAR